MRKLILLLTITLCVCGCEADPLNNPYPAADSGRSILYTTFEERPKHLDPASSYSENEAVITAQVYEPLVQYHFLKQPYELVPLTATEVPRPTYYDAQGRVLPASAPDEQVARVIYRVSLRPGILFQPHPAFAQRNDGSLFYHGSRKEWPQAVRSLADFPQVGTRELVAADYVYQVKRLANPRLNSPIAGFMGHYIRGLDDLAVSLRAAPANDGEFLDLRQLPLAGARVLDRYTFEIELTQKYPQFIYWLAMPFFAPVPWEAERFYAQPGMAEHNLTLDWQPVGTGPYWLSENNPNRRMTLRRNPNFRQETYPTEGAPGDAAAGLLADAGRPLPFIDAVHFMLEKEDIPQWGKFLQGYYDTSPIAPDGFDQAIRFAPDGSAELTPEMRAHAVQLSVATQAAISYIGFNMLDPVVGGASARARQLRQALSIALDTEEMISIFKNGRGVVAQGPIPPGIFGYREGAEGVNPVVYEWRDGRAQRRPLAHARALLAQAGYPEGRDPSSGEPLTLYFDAHSTGPDTKALYQWYRKQFAKLGLRLVVRVTDYNRFQDKVRQGNAQIFSWGWNADYPDPENFLFLLYGPNGKVAQQGENASNYANPTFDRLFTEMRALPNGPRRQALLDQLMTIARNDAPWIWGFHPQAYALSHQWYGNAKPNMMARNTLKYRRIDTALRAQQRQAWNTPHWWPLLQLAGVVLLALGAGWRLWRRRQGAVIA